MQALRVLIGVAGVLAGIFAVYTAFNAAVLADLYLGFGLVYLLIGGLTLIWAAEKANH